MGAKLSKGVHSRGFDMMVTISNCGRRRPFPLPGVDRSKSVLLMRRSSSATSILCRLQNDWGGG